MLRAGCILLTIWTLLNLVPSSMIALSTLFFDGHTPALTLLLTPGDVETLSPEVLATLDSIAIFANLTNVAFCSLVLAIVWMGLHRRQRWAFWSLLAGFVLALLAGVGADYAVGFAAPWVNGISGAVLGLGLAIAAAGLFTRETGSAQGDRAVPG